MVLLEGTWAISIRYMGYMVHGLYIQYYLLIRYLMGYKVHGEGAGLGGKVIKQHIIIEGRRILSI